VGDGLRRGQPPHAGAPWRDRRGRLLGRPPGADGGRGGLLGMDRPFLAVGILTLAVFSTWRRST
jgi:hypothetical protein